MGFERTIIEDASSDIQTATRCQRPLRICNTGYDACNMNGGKEKVHGLMDHRLREVQECHIPAKVRQNEGYATLC
jgi:hypothetical protein